MCMLEEKKPLFSGDCCKLWTDVRFVEDSREFLRTTCCTAADWDTGGDVPPWSSPEIQQPPWIFLRSTGLRCGRRGSVVTDVPDLHSSGFPNSVATLCPAVNPAFLNMQGGCSCFPEGVLTYTVLLIGSSGRGLENERHRWWRRQESHVGCALLKGTQFCAYQRLFLLHLIRLK